MALADRDGLRCAVHLAGGGVHHPAGTAVPHRLQHVQRSDHVGVHKGLWCLVAVRDGDERGEVEDDIHPVDRSPDGAGVPDVTEMHVQPVGAVRLQLVQPAERPT
jgi:hypothetical protein